MMETEHTFVTPEGVALHYRLWRTTRPARGLVVLLHGMASNLTRWSDADDRGKVQAWELYDRVADPEEMRNLADDPSQAETKATLVHQLDAGWRGALPQ